MSLYRLLVALVALLPLTLCACGAALSPPPEYGWVFEVTVTPTESTCVEDLADASEETYTYGLVLEGDVVSIYSDDSKIAEGSLTGKHIGYQSPAPFTDNRHDENGVPVEVEWTLEGEVLFADNELNASEGGDRCWELITVFDSEVSGIETGCTHLSDTVWTRIN